MFTLWEQSGVLWPWPLTTGATKLVKIYVDNNVLHIILIVHCVPPTGMYIQSNGMIQKLHGHITDLHLKILQMEIHIQAQKVQLNSLKLPCI